MLFYLHVCMFTLCVQYLWRSEEGIRSSEAGVTDSHELPCVCWNLNHASRHAWAHIHPCTWFPPVLLFTSIFPNPSLVHLSYTLHALRPFQNGFSDSLYCFPGEMLPSVVEFMSPTQGPDPCPPALEIFPTLITGALSPPVLCRKFKYKSLI